MKSKNKNKKKLDLYKIEEQFHKSRDKIKKKANGLIKVLIKEVERLNDLKDNIDIEEIDEKSWQEKTAQIVGFKEEFLDLWKTTLQIDPPEIIKV